MSALLLGLTVVAALGCGLIAGAFFAFSSFVMKALARLPAPQGIAAMQSINLVVINPWFLGVFLGTGVVCVVLDFWSLLRWHERGAGYLLSGSMLYLVGTIFATICFNVPRNNALAAVDPESSAGAALWEGYVKSWTTWNHVRTIAALAAAALFMIALCLHCRVRG